MTAKYKEWYDTVYSAEPGYNIEDVKKLNLVEKLVNPLDRDIKILDVGCGRGHYLKRLKSLGFTNIYGIEVSEECSKQYLQDLPHEVTDFISFAKLKKDNNYDLIICNDVLEHIHPDEIDEFLDELSRLSNHAIFGIANHSDIHQGIQCHLIIQPDSWWNKKLISRYSNVNLLNEMRMRIFFWFECKK